MFERALYDILTESLQRVVERPTVMSAFLDSLPLDQDLGEREAVQRIIEEFAAHTRPVIHGYARTDTHMPVWSIVLAMDTEDVRPIGDETDEDDDDGQPIKGSVFKSTYQVLVYSEHPDVTLYLYQLIRAILIARRSDLTARAGVLNVTNLAGAELSPDRIWMPEHLFVRAVSLGADAEVRGLPGLTDLPSDDQGLRAGRVVGVHVNDPGRPPDGLSHRVTPYKT